MKAIEIKITIPESVYSKWWGVEKYGVDKTMDELTSDIEKLLINSDTLTGFEIQYKLIEDE